MVQPSYEKPVKVSTGKKILVGTIVFLVVLWMLSWCSDEEPQGYSPRAETTQSDSSQPRWTVEQVESQAAIFLTRSTIVLGQAMRCHNQRVYRDMDRWTPDLDTSGDIDKTMLSISQALAQLERFQDRLERAGC